VAAPDFFEPTLGWRAWHVVETSQGLRLSSVLYPTLWAPRHEEVAVCRPFERAEGETPPHPAPHARCGCGIYASKTPGPVISYVHGNGGGGQPLFRVMGTVALWGTVIEGEHGYRASHAYPARLYIPVNRIQGSRRVRPAAVAYGLMRAYGVEVEQAAIPADGDELILRPGRVTTAPPVRRAPYAGGLPEPGGERC
jgi:hypothetical protein